MGTLKSWLKEVYDGWFGELNENEILIAKERLNICLNCPKMSNIMVRRCTLCNCPISKKVKSMRSKCPDKPSRWGEELEDESE